MKNQIHIDHIVRSCEQYGRDIKVITEQVIKDNKVILQLLKEKNR